MNNALLSFVGGVNKIALAIDSSPISIAVMDEVTLLAERLNATLKVIFVEDKKIINLAETPLVKTVSPFLEKSDVLEKETIERMLKFQISAVKKALEYAMCDKNIEAFLEVRKGNIIEEVLEGAKDCDLLVIGWSGWQAARFYSSSFLFHEGHHHRYRFVSQGNIKLGSTAKAIMQKATMSVLLLRDTVSDAENVAVAYSAFPAARKTLETAADSALIISGLHRGKYENKSECEVSVFIIAKDKKEGEELKLSALEQIKGKDIKGNFISLSKEENPADMVKAFSKAVKNLGKTLVVIADATAFFEAIKSSPELLEDFAGSVFIAR